MCSHDIWNLSSWKCNSTLKYLSLAGKILIYFSMRFFVCTDVKDLHMYRWPKRLNGSTEASVNASHIWFVLDFSPRYLRIWFMVESLMLILLLAVQDEALANKLVRLQAAVFSDVQAFRSRLSSFDLFFAGGDIWQLQHWTLSSNKVKHVCYRRDLPMAA